jgi:dephospho-CoA kinase
MTMILGLTGCPGSGKTVVANVLAGRGWQVIDADRVGKDVVEGDRTVIDALAHVFGQDIVTSDGILDRRLLARRAFAAEEGTSALNAIVHPALIARMRTLIVDERNAGINTVLDCALIFEWGIEDMVDLVVCVHADPEQRMNRIIERDGRTMHEITRLFAAQFPEIEKILRADIAIENNGPVERLVTLARMLDSLPVIIGHDRK